MARGAQEAKEKLESLEGVRLSPKEIAISDSMVDSALRKLREIESIRISAKKAPVDGSMVEEVLGSLREIGEVDIPPQKIEVESDTLAADSLAKLNREAEDGEGFITILGQKLGMIKGTMEAFTMTTEFATAAKKAWNIAMSATAWGTIGIGLGVVAAGIALVASNTSQVTIKTKELNEALDENRERYENAKQAAEDQKVSQLAEVRMVRNLRDEIQELNENKDRSAVEQKLLNDKVERFKELVPEANELITEQNGKYTLQWQEIDKILEGLEAKALAQASENLKIAAYEKIIIAENKKDEISAEYDRTKREYLDAEQEQSTLISKMPYIGYALGSKEFERLSELIGEVSSKEKAFKATESVMNEANLQIAEGQAELEKLDATIIRLSAEKMNKESREEIEPGSSLDSVPTDYIADFLESISGDLKYGDDDFTMTQDYLAVQNKKIADEDVLAIVARGQQHGYISDNIDGNKISRKNLSEMLYEEIKGNLIQWQRHRTDEAKEATDAISQEKSLLFEQRSEAIAAGDSEKVSEINGRLDTLSQQETRLQEEIEDASHIIQEVHQNTGKGLIDLYGELQLARVALENFELNPYGMESERENSGESEDGEVSEKRFATGTTFFQGGVALVGEHGPEIVELPTGAKVHSNDESASLLLGGTKVYLTITGNTFEIPDEAACDRYTEILVRKLQRAALNM